MFNITEFTCRACLEERDVMISIYDDLEDLNTNLSNLLETCAHIPIYENDIFPKYLCGDCTRELLITSKFREKCCKSNEILNEMLENSKLIGTEELSNSNDLIEYCTEDANNIETDDFNIIDTSIKEHPGNIIDELESVHQYAETSLLKKGIIKPLKANELPNEALNEHVIDKTTLLEDNSNKLHMNADQPVEAEVTSVNDYRDYIRPMVQNESMNYFITTSLSPKSKIRHIFKCDVCGALFKQAINLQKHLQKTHGPMQCFICSKCDHCFSLETEFYNHVEECSYTSELSVENIKSTAENITSKTKKTEYSRNCIYCERYFATPFALRMHLRTHTGERPFRCQYCTKSFKTQSQLNVHHKRHTGQADFICSFCNKSFYEQSNLTVHLRSHTGERPHVCTICHKTFGRVFLLQFHMRTHTGEKPFKCNHCDKSFRQHTDLRSHLTIHTGQKQHSCVLCEKSYIKRSHLVQHMRKHQIHANNTETVGAIDSENQHSAQEQNSPAGSSKNNLQNTEIIYSFNEIIESEDIVTHS